MPLRRMAATRLPWRGAALVVILALCRPVMSHTEHMRNTEQGLAKPGSCPRRVLPPSRCVWNQTDECSVDSDCSGVAKCCSTGCAKFCVMPLYTACEQQMKFSIRRSKSLTGTAARSVRVPDCTDDGQFQPVQCDPLKDRCWCVDHNGFEVAGTRARSLELTNCSRQDACAGATCRMLCPYNFKLDERGCPLCQCWDPCQGVQCPGQLSCQLEEMPCANEPCPPVPTCKQPRSLEMLCVAGRPLTFAEGSRPFLCGTDPGKPQCPPLHECHVPSGADYGVCCPSIEKVLAPPGSCPPPVAGQRHECGVPCQFDFQCSRHATCCRSAECGTHCVPTSNKTRCQQKRHLAELMIISEKQGRGYVPQCTADGAFERRQCSRNGLVCWCVDPDGTNVRGTMGPAEHVVCQPSDVNRIGSGRSIGCPSPRCAEVCQYGSVADISGCPTCKCQRPCDEYPCPPHTACVATPVAGCRGPLCEATPTCVALDIQSATDIADYPEESQHLDKTPDGRGTPAVPTSDSSQVEAVTEPNRLPTDDYTAPNVISAGEPASPPADGGHFPLQGGWPLQYETGEVPVLGEFSASVPVAVPLQGDWVEFDGSGDGRGSDRMDQVVDRVVSVLRGHRADTEAGSAYRLDSDEFAEYDEPDVVPAASRGRVELGEYAQRRADGVPDVRDMMQLGEYAQAGSLLDVDAESPIKEGELEAAGDYVPELQQEQEQRAVSEDEYSVEARIQDMKGNHIQALDAEDIRLLGQKQDYVEEPRFQEQLDVGDEEGKDHRFTEKPGQCHFSAPINAGSCDLECASDADCDGEHKCCSSGCGTQCVQPLLATACQHEKAVLADRARSAGVPLGRTYIPHCRNQDGHYSAVQCHPVLGVCWCVDGAGRERPATRTAGRHNVNCSAPALTTCARLDCPAYCPAGRRLDARGCPTCQCHHPCEAVRCSQGLECRPVAVRCVSGPCPPLALCLPAVADPCPAGRPLAGVRCGPGHTACPSSHQCHISPFHEYDLCCPKPRDVCQQPAEKGRCSESRLRWHFDRQSGSCRPFTFSGCGGNQNKFDTEEECKAVCPVLTPCQQLREKNQLAAQLYKRVAFLPKCDPRTGAWESVQCQPEFGLCWCVHSNGSQVADSMVAGVPSCSSRQGRRLSVLPRRTNICERGETVHVCDRSLCEDKVCLARPDASCRIDPCGRCGYRFYDSTGRQVNCTASLTPCQLERQQVLNSAAWRQHGQYEARDRSSVRLYAALLGILSRRPADRASGGHGAHYHSSLLAEGLVVSPPVCDKSGNYRSEQGSGGLMWCVSERGRPLHGTITRGVVRCDRQGNIVERQAMSPICTSDVQPRVCQHECLRASCPGHTDAVCVADPCNNCHITFYSVTGREVECARPCDQPVTSGQCRASIPRFFYDRQLGKCQPFLYGGCGGNDNSFATHQQCQAQCEQPVDICSLPVATGPCSDLHVRWFYNSVAQDCEPFTYGGCAGNGNNFPTRQECQARCPDLVLCPTVATSMAVCSRGQSCGNTTCAAYPSAVCRVEPCSCQSYFTDVNGERVDCEREQESGILRNQVVIVNAVPKTVTVRKVIKAASTTTEAAATPPTTEVSTQVIAEASSTAQAFTAGPELVPPPTAAVERQISRNELADGVDAASASAPALSGVDEVTFALTSPAGEAQSPWGPDLDEPLAPELQPALSDVRQDVAAAAEALDVALDQLSLSSEKLTSAPTAAAAEPEPAAAAPAEPQLSDDELQHVVGRSAAPLAADGDSADSSRRRQGRLLADLVDRQLWAELRSGAGGQLAAVEDHYVALQREVVSRQQGFPLTAAVTVIAALSITVVAATIIGAIVYRRKGTAGAGHQTDEASAPSSDSGVIYNGRSLHEQLGRQTPTQQQPAFRWNF